MEESKILSCAWMWSEGQGDTYVFFPKEALLGFAKELLSISQQTEQQPVAFLYYDDSDVDEDLKLKPFVLVVGNEGPEQHLARRKPGTQGVKPLYAAPIAQTAPQPEQSRNYASSARQPEALR